MAEQKDLAAQIEKLQRNIDALEKAKQQTERQLQTKDDTEKSRQGVVSNLSSELSKAAALLRAPCERNCVTAGVNCNRLPQTSP
jgi:chromosome segregation ATPase